MKKTKRLILRWLGINKLQEDISILKKESISYKNEIERLRRMLESVQSDNELILGHIKFLNSQFFVAADIGIKYNPSVVLIMKRGREQIVKTYMFNNSQLQEIHRILEGFGQDNVEYDQPFGHPRPRFRF